MYRRQLDTAFPQQSSVDTSSSSSNDVSPSIMITVIILAIGVILFASLYLLLRFLRRKRHTTTTVLPHSLSSGSAPSGSDTVSPIIDSLPLFTYDRLTAKNAGDCAVCLSKFEKDDVLRLLPVCCHAFHAECIDTWLSSNLTCPLCRSTIFLPDKLSEHSGSFRVEIGNVSGRQETNSGEIRRSYSLGGAFDYVIAGDENVITEIPSGSFRRTSSSELYKERGILAAEVGTRGGGGGGGWLKDFLSNSLSSSRTASFRGSGRFFTGSSRRTTEELPTVNMENELGEFDEASRLGSEIGELFRWLSGV